MAMPLHWQMCRVQLRQVAVSILVMMPAPGPMMTSVMISASRAVVWLPLFSDADMFHDASDCRRLFDAGSIRLINGANLVVSSRIERGRLRSGDSTRANDSYSDTFTFIADRGDSAVIDLRSGEFDTYLIVRAPGGEEFTNDDYESSFDRSLLSLTLTETGIYEVVVSSYNPGETGGYTVQIETDAGTPADINTQIQGELADGDATFDSGEFNDSYSFEGRPGQRVTLDLRSDEFDTYLILRSPNGESLANDDAEHTSHSSSKPNSPSWVVTR